MDDLISRQAAIDFIDTGHFCNPNEPRWSDNEVVNFLKSRPSARPDVPDTNAGDLISRQGAIDAVAHITSTMSVCLNKYECHGMKRMQRQAVIELTNLPSVQPEPSDAVYRLYKRAYEAGQRNAQPEPIWGLPVSADRPLADVEIVPRLRDIQKQIPGGSYAIDRAIEIIEAVAERRADERV